MVRGTISAAWAWRPAVVARLARTLEAIVIVAMRALLADIQSLSVLDLLSSYSAIVEELRQREVIRTSNNPVADYAEYLCEKALGLTRSDNSTKGIDAIGSDGMRYQIKGRRLTRHNGSRQLGVLRELDDKPFDYLAGVLFSEDFKILKACLLPAEQVLTHSEYIARTNSWRFILRDSVWSLPGAVDISAKLAAVQAEHEFLPGRREELHEKPRRCLSSTLSVGFFRE